MALPRNGFVQPVEVVAGGPLPRNGFVQPVEVIGGAPSSGTPVAGGSGQFYASITAALAGEVQTVISGLVPQAGTGPGVIVGPGTLSPVDDFYKDMFVLNTSLSPSNGLAAQWARVSSYVGATRTFTIDKPWDFSTEASFEVIDPVRIMLFLDIQEDVNVNKNLMIDLGGNRLKGKFDISAADFCWIRGGSGYITNGIQKTDFGLLKMEDCNVSRRDATIYALLLTDGSNVGRCELENSEFMGRVSGRRGKSGWQITNCLDIGIATDSGNDDVPYTLVESVGTVTVALTQLDVTLDSEFAGSMIYSENSVSGGAVYLSVTGSAKFTQDFRPSPTWTPRKFSIAKAVGAGIINVTTSAGGYSLDCNGFRGDLTATNNLPVASLLALRNCTSVSQLILSGILVEISFTNFSLVRLLYIEGLSNSSGNFTLGGTSVKRIDLNGCNARLTEFGGQFTGTLTISGGNYLMQGGSTVGHWDYAVAQAAGAPSSTISARFNSFQCKELLVVPATTNIVGVGTWTVSGDITARHCGATGVHQAAQTGGAFIVSGILDVQTSTIGETVSLSAIYIAVHFGSAGTLTVSGNIFYSYGRGNGITIASALTAGATVSVTSPTVRVIGVTEAVASNLVAEALTATSTSSVTGSVIFSNCIFEAAATIIRANPAGGAVTGPSSVVFEHCVFESTIVDSSGAGTITWAAASLTFRYCYITGLFTVLGTQFTTIEGYYTTFAGSSGNNSISFSGTRPTNYNYWKCVFLAREDAAGTPNVIDEYIVLPASGALTAANLVTMNASGQTTNVVLATTVILGVLINSPAGVGNPSLVMTRGKIMTAVSAGVAKGDHLVADTAGTPTNAVTSAASVSGKNVGFALEARGATVANQSYSAIGVN